MSRLEAQNIRAGYADVTVLDAVDLIVPDGQVTALIGANGSGKSTLLKTMARILSPTGGHVLLDGKDLHRLPTRTVAAQLGLLPQGPVAPEGLIVRELVAQGRYPHQALLRQWSRKDEDAVNAAMSVAGIADFADRAVDTLSGGQRQRCWIAMVLAQDTKLVLLDEPTTFLDLKVQVDLMDLLASLAHEQGRTLVVVLHELSLAAAYADYLVMMKAGRIVSAGTPDETFTAERLKEVFDLDASILRDPASGRLVCVPNGGRRRVAEAAQ
ncbi:iron complex transport system ATP-binding protein [Devosia lucknowensis]|uniref:Iron complex transport system ATP-binding protein n=1 Tax=Devosia lucknowensis TaxID=1096929 RepID=A0A1Y6GBH3_9HYPH|nr:ABC transporter ATP-binding protein [Devosia lucknowensis]SMQ85409.1 iron complex transport system ATP-binding protein [Devosia lucknowensis]